MAEDTFNLFYPWFYQGEMSVEIFNYKKEIERGHGDRLEYNKNELIRLYNDFSNIDLTDKTFLLHIGANCNHYRGNRVELENCKKRLLPQFFISSGLPSVIFIVDNFGDNSDLSELSNDDLIIKKDGENKYIADYGENEDITIYVYNTYFPTYLNENIYYTVDAETTQFIIEKKRESDDKRFVKLFYEKLGRFLSKSYYSVILSTATFRDSNSTSKKLIKNPAIKTEYKIIVGSGNLNLELYPEITEIIKIKKVVFIIWPFESEYFFILKHMVKFNYKLQVIKIYIDDLDEIVIFGKKGYVSNINFADIRLSNYIEYFKDKKRYKTIIE